MQDEAGNTTKEGKELFATEDEAQAFIDKLGGKSENTVEVLSLPQFHVIKIGEKFSWYEQNDNGDTVREGKEMFARRSEVQAFLNEKFPATVPTMPAGAGRTDEEAEAAALADGSKKGEDDDAGDEDTKPEAPTPSTDEDQEKTA